MAEADLRLLLRTIADTTGAEKTSAALRRVQEETKRTTSVTQQMTSGLVSYAAGFVSVAAAAGALGSVLGSSINAQRENERVTRATAAAYGANAQQFERFATALSTQTGFTKQAILEAALTTRTLTANYGVTIEQTQNLIRRSADLASVYGIELPDATKRVSDAIRGEAESAEQLGLTLGDTFIKNNAMNGSLKKTFETMTESQKAQVRYNDLLKQSAQFQGQAANSADSLDGAMNRAASSANKLQIEIGKIAGPPMIAGLKEVARLMDLISGTGPLGLNATRWLAQTGPAGGGGSGGFDRPGFKPTLIPPAQNPGLLPSNDLLGPMLREQIRSGGPSATERASLGRTLDRERQLTTAREIAYLDQRDAAVRDLLAAQQQELDLKTQLVQMEQQHGAMAQRRYQVELSSINAQQRALPAQQALQDTERAMERARLVLDVRGAPVEERIAARGTIRDLERNVAPRQRLAAFDAETGLIAASRQAQSFDLASRGASIVQEQAVARQETLIDAAANRTADALARLESIVEKEIAARGQQKPVTIRLEVLGPDGQVTYEEMIEAANQAQMPPVIRLSGVRR